jgi:hypothetical protein
MGPCGDRQASWSGAGLESMKRGNDELFPFVTSHFTSYRRPSPVYLGLLFCSVSWR